MLGLIQFNFLWVVHYLIIYILKRMKFGELKIRHGNTQQDQLIYVINNFNPGDGINPGPSGSTVPLTESNF